LSGNAIPGYEILERLGEGIFGTVYKARDLELDRFVALRVIPERRFGSREDRWRLGRESAVLAALDHPNLCAVYQTGDADDGALFVAAAFCEGETLARRLLRGALKPAVAVDLAAQIAAGLARAHERGLVHRNLRPTNVFVAADGRAKIVDFGLPGVGEQTLFAAPDAAPTAASYASPEQLQGEWIDARCDVWALGAMLAEMITGRRPAPLEPFGPLRAVQPDAPEELERIVARAMAVHPADRYTSAEELRDDLRGLGSASSRTAPALTSHPSAAAGTASEAARNVGHYRILERIGGGGMGIVHRAEDLRLGRIVALKFLPPDLSRDAVAKARFQQEARAASALDHPNVCTIFEVGETADGQLYIAMPCYEGETLRDRLERGALPVDEAADVAAQIARGLAKAHRQRIVHRDIKPANLILTTDGVVKILDFGIAKLTGAAADLTRAGSTVGTPAYMAPEQMRGDTVDARSDLWSLGVVLYEMLAGRRPFPGEHASMVREAVLNQQPEPLAQRCPEVPPVLQKLTDGLLAKNPADRPQTAEQVAAELRPLFSHSGPAGGTATALAATVAAMPQVPQAQQTPQTPQRNRRLLWGAALLAIAAIAAIAGIIGYVLRRGGEPSSEAPRPPQGAIFSRLTDQDGRETFPSISPDGNYFVYVKSIAGNADIYLQRTAGGNPINLTLDSPVDDTQPAYSPDGNQIAFRSERDGGGLFLMGATGESVRRLSTSCYNPAWSPDGKEILCATEGISDPVLRHTDSHLVRIDVASGREQSVRTGDAVQPSWSPHGLRIAYWGRSHESAQRILWTVAPDGSDPVKAVDDGFLNWNPLWSPDGHYLYYATDRSGSMNLWRLPIDEATGKVRGEAEPIPTPSSWSGLMSLSHDGRRLVYAINESKTKIESASFDLAGATTGPLSPVPQGSRAIRSAAPSPDGEWLAYDTSAPQEDLFVVRRDGSGARRLTTDPAKHRIPRWSPDGKRLLFYSNRGGKYEAWTIAADGSDLRQETRIPGEPVFDPFWAPDGKRILASLGFSGPVVIDLTGGVEQRRPQRIAMPDAAAFSANDWSPDGTRLIGFGRDNELMVYDFTTHAAQDLGTAGRGPFWLPDSRQAVYLSDGALNLLDTRTKATKKLLAPPPGSTFISARPAGDGRSLYFVRAIDEGDIGLVSLPVSLP
jgi:serine/threonine protein kinase/Tol biopolymer transport system component